MSDNIDIILQRTQRYRYDDGLKELFVGALLILTGIALFILEDMSPTSPFRIGAGIAIVALMVTVGLVAVRIIGMLKEHVTYPRTGYVAYKHERKGHPSSWIVIGVALAGAALAYSGAERLRDMSTVIGLIGAAAWGVVGFRYDVKRFYIVAVCSALIGVGASLLGLGDVYGTIAYMISFGLVILISGTMTLRKYLTANWTPDEE